MTRTTNNDGRTKAVPEVGTRKQRWVRRDDPDDKGSPPESNDSNEVDSTDEPIGGSRQGGGSLKDRSEYWTSYQRY